MLSEAHQPNPVSDAQLLQLQSWFSPAFPTGAFTFSLGIESAIADGHVSDAASLQDWLCAVICHGSAWNDAVLMNAALCASLNEDWQALLSIDELALALASGAERLHESRSMGASFARAVAPWLPDTPPRVSGHSNTQTEQQQTLSQLCTLPVISAAAAGLTGLPAEAFIASAMQSSSSNLVWIAARLVPLGQTDALRIIAHLAPTIQRLATQAALSTLDDLGGCALMADIASLRHEQLNTRICRT